MTTITEARHRGEFMVSEADGQLSRAAIWVAVGQNLQAGTVLGRVAGNAAVVVAGTNVGNGTFTMDATTPLLAGVMEGAYRVVMVEPVANLGTFEVLDPAGRLVGVGNVGTAFTGGGIKFLIADGATDFSAGDSWTVYIRAGTVTAGTNTGNGTMVLRGTSNGALVGTYVLTCTVAAANAGTFKVVTPDGRNIGNATVGVEFNDAGLRFIINDGAADFIVGDSFSLLVTRGQMKAYDPAAIDGSGIPVGILYGPVDATSALQKGTAIVRHAEVNKAELVWGAGVTTDAQKDSALAVLSDAVNGRAIIAR
jgi:hypothetical protein